MNKSRTIVASITFVVVVAVAVILYFGFRSDTGSIVHETSSQAAVVNDQGSIDANDNDTLDENGGSSSTPLNREAPTWLVIVLLASLSTTVASLGYAHRLHLSRVRLENTGALVPEEWANFLQLVNDGQKKVLERQARLGKYVEAQLSKVSEGQSANQRSLLTFQKSLDDKDKLIERLRNGYDTQLVKKYLSRLVDLYLKICERSEKADDARELRNVAALLWDTLELAGVEKFEPEIGEKIDQLAFAVELSEQASVETIVETENDTVASVEHPGFWVANSERPEVIKAPIVGIAIFKKERS